MILEKQDATEKSKKRIPKYVRSRIAGGNKQDSLINAGYSASKARVPSLVESTKVYQNVINSILHNTTGLINDTIMSSNLAEITALPVKERVQVIKQLAEIHKILVPTIKIKEEELSNGDIKRTKWSSIGGD